MPYANGLIYIDTTVTPNLGVSIGDVQRAVPVTLKRTVNGVEQRRSSSDLGVLIGSKVGDTIRDNAGGTSWVVSSRIKINKWARYKPQRKDILGNMNYANRSAYVSADESKFGIKIPFCTLDVMNGKVYSILEREAGSEGWEYLRPRGDRTPQGGYKEYYRLTDFVRILTDTTDPYYNTPYAKGYNHRAPVPFVSWMDGVGVTEMHTAERGTWYEVNKQVSNKITILFQNSIGEDLHLQDFIDFAGYPDSQGRSWRPVLQIFNDYTPAGGTKWYNRSQPDLQIIGSPITADTTALWKVELPISSFADNANAFYHLCVGIGCVNASGSSWKNNNEALFILPYTDEQDENGVYPFYYMFSVVSHQVRRLNVTGIQFFADGLQRWESASGTAPYFTIHSLATDLIGITMTVTKYPNQPLKFVKSTDYTTQNYMKIQAKEMINYSERTIYLTPSVGPNPSGSQAKWAENIDGISIPEGQESETVTLYATMYIGDIPVGGYGEYHLKADTSAEQMDDIGYFSIRKIQYGS